ncbi:MAG TPA: FtsX-like permease family protein [Bacteroidia bacterium]|nr:FtsX-like permease family protein [Bacteroidia bacterium]
MNYHWLIAQRILKRGGTEKSSTRPIIRIALTGIAIGMAVMIVALAVVTGFQREIREKVIGFGSHIQITSFDMNNSFESSPINKNQPFYPSLDTLENVRHIQVFATKAGIIKTGTDIQGVMLKGIGSDYDWSYFRNKIISGKIISLNDSAKSDEVLISQKVSMRLKLGVGDKLIMHFIQQPPRYRRFIVSGIYETGLEEFDNLFVLCDIGHIIKLNDWNANEVGGFEVLVNDFSQLDETGRRVYGAIGQELNARTIKEIYPQLFDWLGLQDVNAAIIIVLMIIVAGINMISALLIIMLERTNMIGMLKAMGSSNGDLRRIFLSVSSILVVRGMFWGNIIGIALCLTQKYFQLISLNEESYYIKYVPIHFDFFNLLLLDAGTFVSCTLFMLLPTLIIAGISPVKAIRFR